MTKLEIEADAAQLQLKPREKVCLPLKNGMVEKSSQSRKEFKP